MKLGETLIKKSESVKYLGLILDENLNFERHVEYVIGKANAELNKVYVMIKGRCGLQLILQSTSIGC